MVSVEIKQAIAYLRSIDKSLGRIAVALEEKAQDSNINTIKQAAQENYQKMLLKRECDKNGRTSEDESRDDDVQQ